MRSYREFRKSQIERSLGSCSFQEGVGQLFSGLRVDLMETVRLPDVMLTESLGRVRYDLARHEDFLDNKAILECILRHYVSFVAQDLQEEATALAADPTANVRNELMAYVKRLCQELKDNVQAALAGSRPTAGQQEPDFDGVAPTPAPGGGQPGPGTTAPQQNRTAPNNGAATNGTSGTPGTNGQTPPAYRSQGAPMTPPNAGAQAALGQQNQPGTFTPAPRGSVRPADGFWNGIKRSVIDPVKNWVKDKWQGFRRRWHNDPMREHMTLIENAFEQNHQDVMKVIDDFEKKLLGYVQSNVLKLIGGAAGAEPEAAGDAEMGVPGDAGGITSPQDQQAADLATNPTGQQQTPIEPPEEGTPQAESRNAAAVKGAEMLGITISGLGKRGGTTAIRPANFLNGEGGPIAPARTNAKGEEHPAGWGRLKYTIYDMIFNHMKEEDPQVIENFRIAKRQTGVKGTVSLKDRMGLVNSWLNVSSKGTKTVAIDLLAALYNKSRQVQSTGGTPALSSDAVPQAGASQTGEPQAGAAGPETPAEVVDTASIDAEVQGAVPASELIKAARKQVPSEYSRVLKIVGPEKMKQSIIDSLKMSPDDPVGEFIDGLRHADAHYSGKQTGSQEAPSSNEPTAPEEAPTSDVEYPFELSNDFGINNARLMKHLVADSDDSDDELGPTIRVIKNTPEKELANMVRHLGSFTDNHDLVYQGFDAVQAALSRHGSPRPAPAAQPQAPAAAPEPAAAPQPTPAPAPEPPAAADPQDLERSAAPAPEPSQDDRTPPQLEQIPGYHDAISGFFDRLTGSGKSEEEAVQAALALEKELGHAVTQGASPDEIIDRINSAGSDVTPAEPTPDTTPAEPAAPAPSPGGRPFKDIMRHPEYKTLMGQYLRLVQDNDDSGNAEENGLERAAQFEEELEQMSDSGASVEDIFARLKNAIEEEMQIGNSDFIPKHLAGGSAGAATRSDLRKDREGGSVGSVFDSASREAESMRKESVSDLANRIKRRLRG